MAQLNLTATQERLETTQQALDNTEGQLADTQRTLQGATQRLLDAPAAPLAAPPPPPARPTAIPLPAAFAGDTKTFRDFKTKLNNKFRADAPTFRDKQHRLSVAASLLTGRASDIMRPYVLNDRIDLPNVAEFWKVLDRSFEDPDREGTASWALNSLRQGKDEFSVYYAEFSRLKTEVQ